MKSLHFVLCVGFISVISLPMFGMEDRVAMNDNKVARRLREMAIIDQCTEVGEAACGIACPLVACCCGQDLTVAIHFVLIGAAAGQGAGLVVAGLQIREERRAAGEHKKND
jgi:hypothetical protein